MDNVNNFSSVDFTGDFFSHAFSRPVLTLSPIFYTASPAAHIPFPISAVLQAYHSASFCVARIGLSDSGFFELCFVSLPCSTSSIAGRWLLIFHHFQSVNPLLGRSQLAGACLYVLLTDTTEWRDRPNQWKL